MHSGVSYCIVLQTKKDRKSVFALVASAAAQFQNLVTTLAAEAHDERCTEQSFCLLEGQPSRPLA